MNTALVQVLGAIAYGERKALLGRPPGLLAAILGGHARRRHAVGLAPLGLSVPGALLRAAA